MNSIFGSYQSSSSDVCIILLHSFLWKVLESRIGRQDVGRMWANPFAAVPIPVPEQADEWEGVSVSKPFQVHQTEVEVITVDDEVDNVGELLLKIPSNITVVRQTDKVSLNI